MRLLSLLILLCSTGLGFSQSDQPPGVTGYVTRATSPSDFDVDGWRILCGPGTETGSASQHLYQQGCPQSTPPIGEAVVVHGARNKKQHAIAATRLDLDSVPGGEISGSAVVESVSASSGPGALRVRADGYGLLIDAATEVSFKQPLRSLGDVAPGTWIEYKGRQQPGGTVVVRSAGFRPDLLSHRDEDLRARSVQDPAAVPANAKQNDLSAGFVGVDAAKIPAFSDPAMQARVTSIGQKLVPAWQRKLSASDPAKIDFHFEVTNGKYSGLVLCLPNGNILVPHQTVERLQNDDQVAAVIADAMACVIEKQTFRMHVGVRANSDEVAEAILTSMIPGMPIVGLTGGAVVAQKEIEQSARVSLNLMHEAGYDLTQAPVAWWLLASKEPKRVEEIPMPYRARYFYRILGTTWRDEAAPQSAFAQ